MNKWNKFEFGSLPEPEKWMLVYDIDLFPAMHIAKWTGEGRRWLISSRGDIRYFEGVVTHWMQLPELPD